MLVAMNCSNATNRRDLRLGAHVDDGRGRCSSAGRIRKREGCCGRGSELRSRAARQISLVPEVVQRPELMEAPGDATSTSLAAPLVYVDWRTSCACPHLPHQRRLVHGRTTLVSSRGGVAAAGFCEPEYPSCSVVQQQVKQCSRTNSAYGQEQLSKKFGVHCGPCS